jgi:hypothetical protein
MAYLTMAATIDHGCITVAEPDKLPAVGKALLIVLDSPERKPDWSVVNSIIGTLTTKIDGAAYEREVRSEWDERERREWGNR